ncbi:hypothetical protein [Acrocarpospora pleiomorpha]|uniref:hypothetical protein n=1 Tax=Acrocarpospora pleiomorpha TaxID=90975 RepID=UPI0012D2C7A5|nr:hypothetical protein [Acrocarpospora pleiomorpha]
MIIKVCEGGRRALGEAVAFFACSDATIAQQRDLRGDPSGAVVSTGAGGLELQILTSVTVRLYG